MILIQIGIDNPKIEICLEGEIPENAVELKRDEMSLGQMQTLHLYYQMNINSYCLWFSRCDTCGNSIKHIYDEVKNKLINDYNTNR